MDVNELERVFNIAFMTHVQVNEYNLYCCSAFKSVICWFFIYIGIVLDAKCYINWYIPAILLCRSQAMPDIYFH
jgi:hypothetical protein